MPIRVKCPNCERELQAPSKYRGKKIKCPGCKSPLIVPAYSPTPVPPPLPFAPTRASEALKKNRGLFITLSAVIALGLGFNQLAKEEHSDPKNIAFPATDERVQGRGKKAQTIREIPRLEDQSLDAAIDGRSKGLEISIEDARRLWGGDGWAVLQDRPSETIPDSFTFISKTTDDPRAPWGVVAIGEPGKQLRQLIFTVEIEEGIDPNIVWSVLIGPAGQAAKFSPWSVAELTFWVEVTIREQFTNKTHVPVLYRGCRIAGMIENRHFLITISSPFKNEVTETWSEWMKKHKR